MSRARADYPELAGPVQDRYLLTAMTERQLRMAITEPARMAGSRVDEELTRVLLPDMRARQPGTWGAGVLPLLSHALDQAWRSRAGGTLTLSDYERAGGIEGAVAGSAQRTYDRLTPAQQATARQVFIRLTATRNNGTGDAEAMTMTTKQEAAVPVREAKARLGLTRSQLAEAVGRPVAWTTSALLGQQPMSADEAACGCRKLCHLMRPASIRGRAAEPVPAQNAHTGHVAGWMGASCGRILLQCPV